MIFIISYVNDDLIAIEPFPMYIRNLVCIIMYIYVYQYKVYGDLESAPCEINHISSILHACFAWSFSYTIFKSSKMAIQKCFFMIMIIKLMLIHLFLPFLVYISYIHHIFFSLIFLL